MVEHIELAADGSAARTVVEVGAMKTFDVLVEEDCYQYMLEHEDHTLQAVLAYCAIALMATDDEITAAFHRYVGIKIR